MAPHSSTLAWKIPWMEEPGRLQSMGSRRVGHDWATSLSGIGEGNSNPFQCSCLENPRDRGAWWAAIYGVAQSRTWLKWLSSSSSSTDQDNSSTVFTSTFSLWWCFCSALQSKAVKPTQPQPVAALKSSSLAPIYIPFSNFPFPRQC